MAKKEKTKFITPDIMKSSIIGAFQKLDPRYMIKNPVMFVVELGFFITLVLTIFPTLFGEGGENRIYNGIVTVVLFITVLFANFAESVAEGRGKAQAATLKKTKKDTKARVIRQNGEEKMIFASELRKGDIVLVKMGEVIPNDGEVIEGIASVDESAITGESAPVTRESGGDFSSVTGGTTVVSDWLKIRIVAEPGESFLDKMISLVEGASRQKTPNEIALNTLLIVLTVIFMIVVITLYPFANYLGVEIPISWSIALMVCLIPTTIGGLLSAIGIAGMDRVTRFNVIAMSGKAVEACGDVDTMILDKTGTITYGNRLAAEFYPVEGVGKEELIQYSVLSSLLDETPEGKSTVDLGRQMGCDTEAFHTEGMNFVEFTAQTKMSGVDCKDGTIVRKGASDAIKTFVKEKGGNIPKDLEEIVAEVSNLGGTPLVVCVNEKIYGVIYLKDTVKPGQIRFISSKTVAPVGYIQTKTPLFKKKKVCKYTPEGRAEIHKNLGINTSIMLALMRIKEPRRSVEYMDNRISLYAAQYGRCAVTGKELWLDEIHCHHKQPLRRGGTDKYMNLVIVHRDIHRLIHATDPNTIAVYLNLFQLDKKALAKLNALRVLAGQPEIYYSFLALKFLLF